MGIAFDNPSIHNELYSGGNKSEKEKIHCQYYIHIIIAHDKRM